MLYIWELSNKFDLNQPTRVSHTQYLVTNHNVTLNDTLFLILMLSLFMLNAVMFSGITLCHCAYFCYAECRCSVCRCVDSLYAKFRCHYTECHYAECCNAEFCYGECRYECRLSLGWLSWRHFSLANGENSNLFYFGN